MEKENNIQKNDGTGIGGQVEPTRIIEKTAKQTMKTQKKKFIEYVTRDWTNAAGEPVQVSLVNDAIYAMGSELACLRLAYAYRAEYKQTSVGYSENLDTAYFRLELIAEVNAE